MLKSSFSKIQEKELIILVMSVLKTWFWEKALPRRDSSQVFHIK
jgi:hypothetical protein